MLDGRMVRVRVRKDYAEQPTWVFFGKVVHFSAHWVGIEGRGMFVYRRRAIPSSETRIHNLRIEKGQTRPSDLIPAEIDAENRFIMIRGDTISNIRVLPDDFDLDNIRVRMAGARLDVIVDGAPNTAIDEMMVD